MAKRAVSAHQSWLPEANDPEADFPLTHLPYAAFEHDGEQHLCVAIGAHLLDLHAACGLLPSSLTAACRASTLNALMSLGPGAWELLRTTLTELLHVSVEAARRQVVESALHSISGATLVRPVQVFNYTDFYASIDHAFRVGQLFRPDHPLLPNYKHIPIGYHGRASSMVASGTSVRRPAGQTRPAKATDQPAFIATNALDYELEIGVYVGQGNPLGHPIPISTAAGHLFGISLLNDWSARDIQSWEYQPLGPFLGKSFATSISPWVTPMAALEPFRAPAAKRSSTDPRPLAYLDTAAERAHGNLNLTLEVLIATRTMRENGLAPFRLSQSNAGGLYWTLGQLVAHHTSNGCNLEVGDLVATGTISGRCEDSAGCLLELTRNGAQPVLLPTGETRSFLADGDEIILRGYGEAPGHPRIGLGECRGIVVSVSGE
jgi:fumarylacetoacetase